MILKLIKSLNENLQNYKKNSFESFQKLFNYPITNKHYNLSENY